MKLLNECSPECLNGGPQTVKLILLRYSVSSSYSSVWTEIKIILHTNHLLVYFRFHLASGCKNIKIKNVFFSRLFINAFSNRMRSGSGWANIEQSEPLECVSYKHCLVEHKITLYEMWFFPFRSNLCLWVYEFKVKPSLNGVVMAIWSVNVRQSLEM